MGVMDWYLGMRYKRNTTTGVITLDKSKYAAVVLTRFKDFYRKQAFTDTPMEESIKLPKWTKEYQQLLSPRCQEYVKKYPYRQVVGSLLYLAIWTRPDIIFAVHTVAKHSNHPTLETVHACNRILSYIEHTQHLGLTFCPGHIRLTSFVDCSFVDVIENRKSTGGLIQYIGTSPVYWDSFVANTTVPCPYQLLNRNM
jgi:hypothetical protein